MTGPDDKDWGFPEVGPASTELPSEDADALEALEALSARGQEEGPYDTGSDAWWRAQAEAQRQAAAAEPPGTAAPAPPPPAIDTPPPLVEPRVLHQDVELPPAPPSGPPREAAPEPPAAPPVAPAPPPVASAAPPVAPVAPPPVEPLSAPPPPVEPLSAPPPVEPLTTPLPAPPPLAAAPPTLDPLAPVEPAAPEPPAPAIEDATAAQEPLPPYGQEPAEPFYETLKLPPEPPPVSPVRKLWGALLAVAGVLLVIGALWLLDDDHPRGTPTVALPTPSVAPSATPAPTPLSTPRPTPRATAPSTTAPSAPAVVAASPALAPVRPVFVLNNSRIKGLADRAARRFRAGGWPVSGTGNYRGGTIARTTVYYPPGALASAQRFARQFGVPRVLPRFAGLPGSGLTVVLTRDYA